MKVNLASFSRWLQEPGRAGQEQRECPLLLLGRSVPSETAARRCGQLVLSGKFDPGSGLEFSERPQQFRFRKGEPKTGVDSTAPG